MTEGNDRMKEIAELVDVESLQRDYFALVADCARLQEELNNMTMERNAALSQLSVSRSSAIEETVEMCAKVAEAEPELPGSPTYAALVEMEERPIEFMRATVRVTKRSIAAAIRSLLKDGSMRKEGEANRSGEAIPRPVHKTPPQAEPVASPGAWLSPGVIAQIQARHAHFAAELTRRKDEETRPYHNEDLASMRTMFADIETLLSKLPAPSKESK